MSKEIIGKSDVEALLPVERAVLCLLVFIGWEYTGNMLRVLIKNRFGRNPASLFNGVSENLMRTRGFPIKPGSRQQRRSVCWTGKLTAEAAAALVRAADDARIWPEAADWAQADVVENPYWSSVPNVKLGEECRAICGLMRHFICSPGEAPDAELDAALQYNCRGISRAAAWRLVAILPELPAGVPFGADPHYDGLLLSWLNLAFVNALDVRPVLRGLSDRLERGGPPLGDELRHVYLSLCVWTGWREGLKHPALTRGDKFVRACQILLSGKKNIKEADTILRKIWDAHRFDQTDKDADNFPVRLLMHTVCMVAKPGKTRPSQVMRGFFGGKQPSSRTTFARDFRDKIMVLSYAWSDGWSSVCSNTGKLIRYGENEKRSDDVLFALLLAWDYHALATGRASVSDCVVHILRHAPRVLERGYVNLAGLFLALLAGGYETAKMAAVREAVDRQGTWLIPLTEPEPEWKTVMALLQRAVAQAKDAQDECQSDARTKRLVWIVEIDEDDEDGSYAVTDILPAVRENRDKSEKSPLMLDVDDLGRENFKALMTPADRLLYGYLMSGIDYYRDYTISRAAVEQLCDMDNLECTRERKRNAYCSVTFEKQACTFESVVREDGGLTLSVPDWIADCRTGYSIRRIAANRYAVVSVSSAVAKLAKLFAQYGNSGRIEIPREGMAAAETVVNDLSAVVPLANPTAQNADNLPRVTGSGACVARLDFADGVLSIRIVVRPLPTNAAFVLEPGIGLAEKLVAGATGSYWLVRDLDAERTAFGEVRAVLSEAEEWFDGRAAWTIDDIAAAIGALAALKTLGEKLPLEWIDTRRLNVATVPKHGATLQSSRTADEWFSVKGTFALDDGRVLNVLELLAAMSSREGRYVRLSDGDYVALTKSMAREMAALAAVGRRKGGELEVSRAALPMLDDAFREEEDALPLPEAMAASASEIRAALKRTRDVPRALTATLRPYQSEGYAWLSRLAACGFGMCLADDMGLGKTVQVIALLLERIQDGPSLVVAPASVCGNWRQEIRRFAPTLNPILAFEYADDGLDALKPGDVLIASYGYLLFHAATYGARAWNGVVLDEAQAIKNDASKRAHAVKRLSARFRVAATGTPVENHLGELWSLFDFLNPGLLGPASSFAARFTKDGKAIPALKKVVKPLILRRLKGDVLDDLPPKTEVTIPIALGKEERSAYEGCRLHALANLTSGEGEQSRISILAELTRLRRYCCHPSLVLGAGCGIPSAKMEALVELLESLHQGQHKALVFSQFTDYLALVRQMVEAHGWGYRYLDGSTSIGERERLVNEFQTGESEFFLISLKAGGTGLNLTAANYVILLDPWWNPAVENQAADRAHRIGQKQPVTIYRLVASDTVEERVIELHREKNAMASDLLEGTAKSSFTPEDLIRLFS